MTHPIYHNILRVLLPAAFLLGSMTACNDDDTPGASSLNTTRGNSEAYRNNLLRSYGVGYGYDATGEYASYNSVRDCVIDLKKLQKVDPNIFTDNLTPRVEMNVCEGFDSEELATNLTAQAGIKIDLGVFFEAEVSATYSKVSLKTDEYSFCTISNNYIKASRHMDPLVVRGLAEEGYDILSAGFRRHIDHISTFEGNPDALSACEMAIDTLLMYYGTHFIYQASLGGALRFNSVFTKSSLGEASSLTIEAKAQLAGICSFDYKDESGDGYKQRQTMTSHSLKAVGGDVTRCSAIIQANGKIDYDNVTKIDKSIIQSWYESINFTPGDDKTSNVELVDFRLAPIYELIPDVWVREQVANRFGVYRQQAEELMPKPVNTTFCKIPIKDLGIYTEGGPSFFRIRDEHDEVIAEVVTEQARVKGELQNVSTVYPVIGGRVAEEGLAMYLYPDDEPAEDDSVYVVSWMEDSIHNSSALMPLSELDTLYYNNGQLGVLPLTARDYQEIRPENLDMDQTVYCWDGYYGVEGEGEDAVSTLFKIGRYYVMPGPILQAQSTPEKDNPNDYQKVLADPPYGWEFATTDCGIFHQCKDYLETFLTYAPEVWRHLMFLPSIHKSGTTTTYNFSVFFPGDEHKKYYYGSSMNTQDLLEGGQTPVMLVRSIPYYYR